MRRISLLFIFCLICVSCRLPESGLYFSSNPFLEAKTIVPDKSEIVFFTDMHVGRENTVDGIKRYDENFFSFLEKKDYPLIISGGDMADDGAISEDLLNMLGRLTSFQNSMYLETLGNHDWHPYNYRAEDVASFWYGSVFDTGNHMTYAEKLLEGLEINEEGDTINTIGRYVVKRSSGEEFLSVYILDNSSRTFSSTLLKWLSEALDKDRSRYRIVVTHENILSGGNLDPSLILFGSADEGEVARFMKIMEAGRVSLVLTGHYHKGNVLYGDGSSYTEFTGASYHSSTSPFESTAWWYTIFIDEDKNKITINGIRGESGEVGMTWDIKAK